MSRRNSKDVRISKLSQRALQRLERNKQRSDRRYDGTTWADKLLDKLNRQEEEENGTNKTEM